MGVCGDGLVRVSLCECVGGVGGKRYMQNTAHSFALILNAFFILN